MNIIPRMTILILLAVFVSMQPVFADFSDESSRQDEASSSTGYALVMANGIALKISEYEIDLDRETVYFKSLLSGLNATFPLERIARVVAYDTRLAEVPDDASPLFIPEKSVNNIEDDGGIPVVFKVTKTIVGSSGAGSSGYSRAGAGRSGDYRQSYTPTRSSGYSSSSSSTSSTSRTSTQSQTSSSTSRRPTSSSSSSSSSSSAADNFFNALFGGR